MCTRDREGVRAGRQVLHRRISPFGATHAFTFWNRREIISRLMGIDSSFSFNFMITDKSL